MNRLPSPIVADAVYHEADLARAMGLPRGVLASARRNGVLRYRLAGGRIVYLGQWALAWLESGASDSIVPNAGDMEVPK